MAWERSQLDHVNDIHVIHRYCYTYPLRGKNQRKSRQKRRGQSWIQGKGVKKQIKRQKIQKCAHTIKTIWLRTRRNGPYCFAKPEFYAIIWGERYRTMEDASWLYFYWNRVSIQRKIADYIVIVELILWISPIEYKKKFKVCYRTLFS